MLFVFCLHDIVCLMFAEIYTKFLIGLAGFLPAQKPKPTVPAPLQPDTLDFIEERLQRPRNIRLMGFVAGRPYTVRPYLGEDEPEWGVITSSDILMLTVRAHRYERDKEILLREIADYYGEDK